MAGRSAKNPTARQNATRHAFPFTAIVGQEEMKLALLLNVIAPSVGGVLIMGHRGTGKSTAVRALAELLPPVASVAGCHFNCDPSDARALCGECAARSGGGEKLKGLRRRVPVVELPLGATEDRVCGTIDLGRALREGVKAFEPGLLARANRGFLYIDEVNLLEDHLVDLLLDVSATGRNRVEREGVSAEHPARFVLVGSGNPEEGELRPQLLDRFGLCAEVETMRDVESRVRVVENREAFDRDPAAFAGACEEEQARVRRRVLRASKSFGKVEAPRALLCDIAELCTRLGIDGHRGEITIARAARALAAYEGRKKVSAQDVRRVASLALRHRLRRDPLEQGGGGARVENCVEELFGESPRNQKDGVSKSKEAPRGEDQTAVEDFGGETNGGGSRAKKEKKQGLRGDGPDGDGAAGEELSIPSAEVGLRRGAFDGRVVDKTRRGFQTSTAARRSPADVRRSQAAARGRYSGAAATFREPPSVALDATLRAAAPRIFAAAKNSRARTANAAVPREDLRFKRFRGKAGTLYVFLVDASGSMAANRIGQAKGALAQLLRRAYVNRDRVALISARGGASELLLAPSGSVSRARRVLDELPVGGATPLASGLRRALDVSLRAASGGETRRVRLFVFTDGRANVPLSGNGATSDKGQTKKELIRGEIRSLGASLRAARVESVVIDTQGLFTSGGEGEFLAGALGGSYLRLPQVISGALMKEALANAGP